MKVTGEAVESATSGLDAWLIDAEEALRKRLLDALSENEELKRYNLELRNKLSFAENGLREVDDILDGYLC